MAAAITIATAKYFSTSASPSIRSPMILAKPVMWMRIVADSCFARSASTWRANSA